MAIFERQLLLQGPIFDFHDYGRKCKPTSPDFIELFTSPFASAEGAAEKSKRAWAKTRDARWRTSADADDGKKQQQCEWKESVKKKSMVTISSKKKLCVYVYELNVYVLTILLAWIPLHFAFKQFRE